MTMDVAAADRLDPVMTGEPTTRPAARPGPPRKKRTPPEPDQYIKLAKQMAVRNFNESRDPDRSKAITEDQVFIVGFQMVMSHWKATVGSSVARNLLWEVTYNAFKKQVYIDAFRKISNTMVQLEDGE